MSNLNEREIEALKRVHPRKKYLRFGFLAIGIFIIFLGFLFLVIGFDFRITLEGINLSLFICMTIMIFGGIITSKFFIAPYYLRENSITFKKVENLRETIQNDIEFYSISFSRFIASLLLILAGFISLLVFGTDAGHEVKYGSAIFLGGPSWFYVTGLPILGIGFGLLLYFFLSIFRGIFSESTNFLFFYEIRPGFPWLTEIPINEIEAVRYQNNHLGPKLTWIILLIPFIAQQLMTAIPLFFAERAAPSFVLSWTFLIISILEIIALVLLVIYPQSYFEIATKERLYEMWFSPFQFKEQANFKEKFSMFLGCKPDERDEEAQSQDNLINRLSDYHIQYLRVIFGAFLVGSSILMLSQMVLFGPLLWWISLLYGLILIVKSLFYDFNLKEGDTFYLSQEKNIFKFRRLSRCKFNYIKGNKYQSVVVRKWFRKLDFFDIFGISGMLVFLVIQQTQGWIIADTISLVFDNLISSIFMIVMLFFILYYLCYPIDVIEFRTHSIKYQIEITLRKESRKKFFISLSNFKENIKHIAKSDMRRTFLFRFYFVLLLITGTLIYMLLYFLIIY